MAGTQHPTGESARSDRENDLWLLADLAGQLVSLDNPGALQEQVLEHALQMFHCLSGAVCLWDGDGSHVRLGHSIGNIQGLRPDEILRADPVRSVVLGDRRPLILAESGAKYGLGPSAWKGMAIIPVPGQQGVLGMLVIGDLQPDRSFSESDEALMAVVGSLTAAVLETRLTFETFRQQMTLRMTETMAELGRAAGDLQRLKTFNEELFDSAPVGIVVFDSDFRITFRNAAADRLWPADRQVFAGAGRTDVARQDPDWESALRDVINMQQPWRVEEVTFQRANEEPIRVNLTCSPLFTGKRMVAGGVLIVEDVTQRVTMERRLAVSERLAGVGRLAAMVAHEINNPLDGTMRFLNLARRVGAQAGDPRVEQYLADAHKGLARVAAIVRDLLDFSRTASGSVEPRPIPELIAEAARTLAPAAEEARVEIATDCDLSLPLLKSGSLYHVVVNLVKNAIEAMPQGGRVDVRARGVAGAIVIEVADTGPGIPPEVLPRLFEPFYTLKAMGKGTGLGLVICKDLVEKQGGTITAANRPEGGAVFTVTIPVARA